MVQDRNILDWTDLPEVPESAGNFKPEPFYDPRTDSVTLYFDDDESYRERVDGYLTVYRSIATKTLVGCHIKSVMKVLESVKGFLVGIHTDEVTFGLLLMAAPWAEMQEADTEQIRFHQYREIAAELSSQPAAQTPIDLVGCC